jgi:hypothetical protein
VNENERRTSTVVGAADRIAKPSSAPVELALLESLPPMFALRHH